MGIASVFAIAYYLRVVLTMIFEEPDTDSLVVTSGSKAVVVSLAISVAAIIIFGVAPNLLGSLLNGFALTVH